MPEKEVGVAGSVDWDKKLKQVREECQQPGEDCASLPADICKDCHTSWYADVILKEVVDQFGYD